MQNSRDVFNLEGKAGQDIGIHPAEFVGKLNSLTP